MNLNVCIIGITLLAVPLHAQLYRGTVINAVTKNAVTGVTVTLQRTGASTATDTSGTFVFWDATGSVSGNGSTVPAPRVFLAGGMLHLYGHAGPIAATDMSGSALSVSLQPDGRIHFARTSGIVFLMAGHRNVWRVLLVNGRANALSTGTALSGSQQAAAVSKNTVAAGTDTLVLSRNGYLPSTYAVTGPADTLAFSIEREYGIPVFSDFTDGEINRSYFPFVDNETWQISTYCCGTGRNHFMLENCVFTDTVTGDSGSGYLHMTVQANTTNGAELWSTMKTHYGFYETRMKTSDISGACNAFFLHDWNNAHIGEEVDLEFLTDRLAAMPDTSGEVMCMLHPNGGGSGRPLPFNPGTGFHRYGWLWTPDSLCWVADGAIIQTVKDTLLIPNGYVQMVYNNWTGSAGWGGGPPLEDNTMIIDWCRYYPDADTVVPLE